MRLPRFWAKESRTGKDIRGKVWTCSAWGWSFESLSEARQNAAERASRMLERLSSGTRPERYDYLETPLREEIIETLGSEKEPVAVVTRNRYGALVLNAARVCFVDIDFPERKPAGLLNSLAELFSKERREAQARAQQEAALKAVDAWAQKNRRVSFRVYLTCAGLRLLFTDKLYDPAAGETEDLFHSLGSDPLYRKLTQKQECFRARLSPKPWRIKWPNPPSRYPWQDSRAEQLYRDWLRGYESKSSGVAVCRLVKEYGRASSSEAAIRLVVSRHDRCVADSPTTSLV